jgi:HAMP domain-containing protein
VVVAGVLIKVVVARVRGAAVVRVVEVRVRVRVHGNCRPTKRLADRLELGELRLQFGGL